mgnify:CR=1 FL=1
MVSVYEWRFPTVLRARSASTTLERNGLQEIDVEQEDTTQDIDLHVEIAQLYASIPRYPAAVWLQSSFKVPVL